MMKKAMIILCLINGLLLVPALGQTMFCDFNVTIPHAYHGSDAEADGNSATKTSFVPSSSGSNIMRWDFELSNQTADESYAYTYFYQDGAAEGSHSLMDVSSYTHMKLWIYAPSAMNGKSVNIEVAGDGKGGGDNMIVSYKTVVLSTGWNQIVLTFGTNTGWQTSPAAPARDPFFNDAGGMLKTVNVVYKGGGSVNFGPTMLCVDEVQFATSNPTTGDTEPDDGGLTSISALPVPFICDFDAAGNDYGYKEATYDGQEGGSTTCSAHLTATAAVDPGFQCTFDIQSGFPMPYAGFFILLSNNTLENPGNDNGIQFAAQLNNNSVAVRVIFEESCGRQHEYAISAGTIPNGTFATQSILFSQFTPPIDKTRTYGSLIFLMHDVGQAGDLYIDEIMIGNTSVPTDRIAVVSTVPTHNSTSVSSNLSQIVITFNSNMNASSVQSAFSASGITLSGSAGDGTTTITLSVSGALAGGTTYNCSISTAAQSSAGGNLQSTYNFSFTTESNASAAGTNAITTYPDDPVRILVDSGGTFTITEQMCPFLMSSNAQYGILDDGTLGICDLYGNYISGLDAIAIQNGTSAAITFDEALNEGLFFYKWEPTNGEIVQGYVVIWRAE